MTIRILYHNLRFVFSILLFLIPLLVQAQTQERILVSKQKMLFHTGIGTHIGSELTRNTGNFKLAYNFDVKVNYLISSRFQLGLGLAIEKYEEETLLPLYINAQAYFRYTPVSPFLSMQTGWSLGWHEDYDDLDIYQFDGGWLFNIAYGYRLPIADDLNFYVMTGLSMRNVSVNVELSTPRAYREQIYYVLLNIQAGIQF